MASDKLLAALLRPQSYPGEPDAVALRETHISWVFLAGDRAYKLKKPLVLPFLDYGTAARRLAAGIYLGVRGVVLAASGALRLVDDEHPEAVDYLVEMRRYDERATLAEKLARHEVGPAEIVAVAEALARFHAAAAIVSWRAGPVLEVERRFEQNAHELAAGERQREQLGRILALERFAHAFISAHAALLEERVRRGCVRDGHGDIRAEHVVLEHGVQIVDCVEFSPALRELDVADDLAFLVLDLAARGGGDLGDQLIEAYRAAGGDAGDPALICFYAAYRALVRAKVALLRSEQERLPGVDAEVGAGVDLDLDLDSDTDTDEVNSMIGLAERFAWRARLPLVIVVCGTPASGKSHLAGCIARASGLPQINSDETRKRLAGIEATQRAPAAAYSDAFNALTYAELAAQACASLSDCGGAIVDATFRHLRDRRTFASRLATNTPLLFVECQAPLGVLAARAHARRQTGDDASDADLTVVLRERAAWEPLDEVDPWAHVVLRTDRPAQDILADLLALLDRRMGRVGATSLCQRSGAHRRRRP
jgi:hypothetical protein